MTVSARTVRSGPFIPNGVTTTFPFDFETTSTAEVAVELDGVTLDTALFEVTLNDDGTGSVTLFTAPVGSELFVVSDPLFQQPSTFRNQGPYFQRTVETTVDRLARADLWLRDGVMRAPLVPPGEEGLELTSAAERANRIFGFDGLGRFIAADGVVVDTGVLDDGIWLEADSVVDDGTWTSSLVSIAEDGVFA